MKILIPEVPYITGRATDEWRARLASSGDIALAEWADELANDQVGRHQVSGALAARAAMTFRWCKTERMPESVYDVCVMTVSLRIAGSVRILARAL